MLGKGTRLSITVLTENTAVSKHTVEILTVERENLRVAPKLAGKSGPPYERYWLRWRSRLGSRLCWSCFAGLATVLEERKKADMSADEPLSPR